tara:strand:+ start:703 stop:1860 length:1158 start_codon:yes stop_codon:yes gene_type:complete
MKKRITVVLTSRGNYAKSKKLLSLMALNKDLSLSIVLGGSLLVEKYGKIINSSRDLKKTPVYYVPFILEGDTTNIMAKSTSLAINEFVNAFSLIKPEMVVVIGDRFESLGVAIAATYMNIKLVHVEGGERSGSIDEPIRHAITKLAHLHFPCSKDAAKRIERMGEKKEYIFNVGATSFDILQDYKNGNLDIINEMIRKKGVGDIFEIERYKYLLFVCHPITTEDHKENLALLRLCEYSHLKKRLPIIWIWPNLDAGTEKISKAMRELREEKVENIHFFKSLKIDHFAPLLSNCGCIVGNSSSGIREASYLGIPSINIGNRQSMRQRCKNIIDMNNNKNNLKELINIQLKKKRFKMDTTYGDGKASERILKILIGTNPDLQKVNSY